MSRRPGYVAARRAPIVIDDIGMLTVAPNAAEALCRVVGAAYERRSIALTEHPPQIAGFDELMPKTLGWRTPSEALDEYLAPAA